MKDLVFTPEDFSHHIDGSTYPRRTCAEIANAKLNEWLERAPVYYGSNARGAILTGYMKEDAHYDFSCRVVCEQPLVQESEERKLLREFVRLAEMAGTFGKGAEYMIDPSACSMFGKSADRARKLLEPK